MSEFKELFNNYSKKRGQTLKKERLRVRFTYFFNYKIQTLANIMAAQEGYEDTEELIECLLVQHANESMDKGILDVRGTAAEKFVYDETYKKKLNIKTANVEGDIK